MNNFIKFIDRFDQNNPQNLWLRRFITILAIIVFFTIASVFCYSAFKKSLVKDFWVDENYGLITERSCNLSQLLIQGDPGQGSPAPLDYIFLKVLDNIRKPFHLEWIPLKVYYRLNSMFWNLVAGLGIIFLFFNYFRYKTSNCLIFLFQVVLLAQALGYFYFRHDNLHFSVETRPYALWNSLWFSLMALFLFYRKFNWILLAVSTALAMTSSGSLFQLLVFAMCRFGFQWVETKQFLMSLKQALLEFAFPLLISIYYSSKCPHFAYSPNAMIFHQYLTGFYAFWASKYRVFIFAIMGISMTLAFKNWRQCSIVFFTTLFLYILSPVCNYVVLCRGGLFFSNRQYLYYELAFSVLALGASLILPDFWERLRGNIKPQKSIRSKATLG